MDRYAGPQRTCHVSMHHVLTVAMGEEAAARVLAAHGHIERLSYSTTRSHLIQIRVSR
jgi:hypothetical protein